VDVESIRSGIRGLIGKELLFFDAVGSTNTVALSLTEDAEEGTVVLADYQEKGRGRFDRPWVSPSGVNIYMSVLLRPSIEPDEGHFLTLFSAVACAHALRETTGLPVAIKWPNDLMVANRKLGGILTEVRINHRDIVLAVIGIGVNINMEIADLPEPLRRTATSVIHETGQHAKREPVIAGILNHLDYWYGYLKRRAGLAIIDEWKRLTSTLGRTVIVTRGSETYTGLAEEMDEKGGLIVRLPTGERRRLISGDLSLAE